MTEKPKPTTCAKCGGALEQPATGRPRRYCSKGCRSSAAYELRRITRRLERLENARSRVRPQVARGEGDYHDQYAWRRVVRELEEVESEIVLDEARLRALLAQGLDELPVEVERVRAPK